MPNLESLLRKSFLRALVATAPGRAHLLSLMVAAEEGDEAGVFDLLIGKADDDELRKLVRRHKEDEERHAGLFRACLERTGIDPGPVPDELKVIRQVGLHAGGAFAAGAITGSTDGLDSREDVMNTYALLLAIEERGVANFPVIGAEFRRIGDHETADVFDRVTRDEARHTKYCRAIGRRYAFDDATWERAVRKYRALEDVGFKAAGLAGIRYASEHRLAWHGPVGRLAARLLQTAGALATSRALAAAA